MYAGIGVYVYMFIHEWLKQRLQLYQSSLYHTPQSLRLITIADAYELSMFSRSALLEVSQHSTDLDEGSFTPRNVVNDHRNFISFMSRLT